MERRFEGGANNERAGNKTVLLVVPNFHDYTNLITDHLKKMGFNVISVENKHFFFDYRVRTTFLRNLRKPIFKLLRPDIKYFKNKLKPLIETAERIDYFFCIDSDCLSDIVFDCLKATHPQAIKLLYMWDTLSVYEYDCFLKYFDKVYSFDHQDAKKFGLSYLPNFVVPDDNKVTPEKEYDIYFLGKQYGSRFQLIKRVYDAAVDNGLRVFIKLYVNPRRSLFLRYFYKVFRHFMFLKSIREFCLNYELENDIVTYPFIIHEKISLKKSMEILKKSKSIIDICFDSQTGASHRVMQALYYNLKVITNNKLIVQEEFYSPRYIKVIDFDQPDINENWINAPGVFNHSLMAKYEIGNWLNTIFTMAN